MGLRGLQALLTLLGLVALIAGGATVVTGAALISDAGAVSPSVDSELRFYAAWYAVAGAALLEAARHPIERRMVVGGVCVALLVGAGGRAISLLTAGTPHRLYVVLMVIELVLPVVIGPWLAAVTRRQRATG